MEICNDRSSQLAFSSNLPDISLELYASATTPSQEVAILQRLLAYYGYLQNQDVDGWMGTKTDAAIQSFQRKHHLIADGVVGAITWRTLANVQS